MIVEGLKEGWMLWEGDGFFILSEILRASLLKMMLRLIPSTESHSFTVEDLTHGMSLNF